MGVRSDTFRPYSRADGEAAEALLEKSPTEVETQSIDLTSPVHIVTRPARARNLWIVLTFALFNIAGLATIYFILASRPPVAPLLSPPADRVFPPRR
jgi:hypothetical protein